MKHKIIDANLHTTIINLDGGGGGGDARSAAVRARNIRFLGVIKQPGSDPYPFELDESDVVWSSDLPTDDDDSNSRSPPTASTSPTSLLLRRRRRHHHHQHQFHPVKSGLSAALSDDHHPLIRRKSTLDPSLSAATAARAIRTVPMLRSEGPNPKFHQSAPVNVPMWSDKKIGGFGNGNNKNYLGHFDEVEEDGEGEEEEIVPPHEIVARSHVTFSVFEGVGRTLKGRDLRRVRNAVFQRTGFID